MAESATAGRLLLGIPPEGLGAQGSVGRPGDARQQKPYGYEDDDGS